MASFESLRLSMRARVSLRDAGISTIDDLLTKTERDLGKIKNLGRITLADIVDQLRLAGLSLQGPIEESKGASNSKVTARRIALEVEVLVPRRNLSMSPLEAKQIIESLANGIDPETGEILPAQSPVNSPQVIRALFVAGKALDSMEKRAGRKNLLPGNAGLPWTEEEDRDLLASFDAGTPLKDVATKHSRTQGAIASRLVRLGRIKDRSELRVSTQPEIQNP